MPVCMCTYRSDVWGGRLHAHWSLPLKIKWRSHVSYQPAAVMLPESQPGPGAPWPHTCMCQCSAASPAWWAVSHCPSGTHYREGGGIRTLWYIAEVLAGGAFWVHSESQEKETNIYTLSLLWTDIFSFFFLSFTLTPAYARTLTLHKIQVMSVRISKADTHREHFGFRSVVNELVLQHTHQEETNWTIATYRDLLLMGSSWWYHLTVGGGSAVNWQWNLASSFLSTTRSSGLTTGWG